MNGAPALVTRKSSDRLELVAKGDWTAEHAHELELLIETMGKERSQAGGVAIDVSDVGKLDTFGAWLIERLLRALGTGGSEARLIGLPPHYKALLDELEQVTRIPSPTPRHPPAVTRGLTLIGVAVADMADSVVKLVQMLGQIVLTMLAVLIHPSRFRATSTVFQLERVGWRAVPIVILITFLIGAIIAQQGIFHFRRFGADVFVVDMVGILVLREIGVLIVCIMVAGRSGSAYTAELGTMKMREEIDALQTMGLDPIEVLILPRMIALVIAVPILTFLGSMAALYGGGLVCWVYGGIEPEVFLARLREAISIDHFLVGITKAPFMALTIGIVACNEGLQVKGSAQSLGQQTTASVVKSIFLVIVLDGLFAMFFAAIGI